MFDGRIVTSVADRSLPLAELLDAVPMAAALATALGSDAGAVTGIEVLEHKPGRRSLLRYETDRGTFYGKAFPDAARAVRTHEVMEQVAGAFDHANAGLTAPRPLGLVSRLGLVLYEPLRGPSLDALAGADATVDALAAAGRWITVLHGATLDLSRVLDLHHESANAGEWSALVADAFPDLAGPSARLAASLADAVPGPALAAVPIHKDFHYQHVIVGNSVGVVDLDEARLGDRLLDVGHFIVNLELLARRTGTTDVERDRWVASFVASCGLSRADDERLRWHAGYTCLKLAKQLANGQGPRPRPSGPERHDQVTWALGHGLSVMDA